MKKNFAVAHSLLLLPLVCSISLMSMDQLVTSIEDNKRMLSDNECILLNRISKLDQTFTTEEITKNAAFINNCFKEQRDLAIKTKTLECTKIETYYTSLFEKQEEKQKSSSAELHQLIVAKLEKLNKFEHLITDEQRKEKEELLVLLKSLNVRKPQEIDTNEMAENNFFGQLALGYFFYLWSQYIGDLTEHSFH
jgi:hypothetical protein